MPRALSQWGEETLIRRTLMQRDRELVEKRLYEQTNSQAEILWTDNGFEPWPIEQ